MAKDERPNYRLRQKLPGMPEKQGLQTPTLWPVVTRGAPIRTIAVNCDGLHHRTPYVGNMRPAMGSHRPIHQNCALHPTPGKNRGRSGNYLRPRGMEAPHVKILP